MENKWAEQEVTKFFVDADSNVVLAPPGVRLDTRSWMQESMGYTQEQADNAIRGYLSAHRIVFFQGSHYGACPRLNATILRRVFNSYKDIDDREPVIYNGVYRGAEGEVWPPILYYDEDLGWQIAEGWLE